MCRSYRRYAPWVLLIAGPLLAILSIAAPGSESSRALFEPPDGQVYHGAASNPTVVAGYLTAIADPTLKPLIEGIHLGAAGTAGRQYVVDTIRDLSLIHI